MYDNDRCEYFECECHIPNHLMKVEILEWKAEVADPNDLQLTISGQLNHYLPFHERVWLGLKYMFGHGNGEWYGTTLYSHKDALRLQSVIEDYLKRREKLEKKEN